MWKLGVFKDDLAHGGQTVTATAKAAVVTLVSTSDEDTSEYSAARKVASS